MNMEQNDNETMKALAEIFRSFADLIENSDSKEKTAILEVLRTCPNVTELVNNHMKEESAANKAADIEVK
jgi:hypothetical protein